jgi:16S rRNA (guanine527-N7)-methyltransferase
MEAILNYFPNLTDTQKSKLAQLESLYKEWNQKINVISRKDIDSINTHHVLHSLGIAKFTRFTAGTKILDVGTGGGFPGIPLAILFPEVEFHLIDSIAKKILVVNEVAKSLQLTNVKAWQSRVQDIPCDYDFVVSRAVTAFPAFVSMSQHAIKKKQQNAIPNGILYLKGGDFNDELKPFGKRVQVIELRNYFKESFFETKKLIHLPV